MNSSKEILFFVSAIGAFNGFLLSCYLFFFSKIKKPSINLLGCLLLALSVRIGKSVLLYFNPNTSKVILQIGLSACFLIGPFCYYFLKSSINQKKEIPHNWLIMIGLYIITIAFLSCPFIFTTQYDTLKIYLVYGIYLQWFCYLLASTFLLETIIKKSFNAALSVPEKWVLIVLGSNILIFFSYVLGIFNAFQGAYISGALTFSFVFYLIIFIFLDRKKSDALFSFDYVKYNHKKIQNDEAIALLERLEMVIMENEMYKNPNLKLNDLAQKMKLSDHQLSQLLNDNLGKNFSVFINEYRINKACEIIATDSIFKIEGIGYEVGFNSKSTFFSAFKKQMGTTPALFKENLSRVV
jgi:AraC-like DNA-binding protein